MTTTKVRYLPGALDRFARRHPDGARLSLRYKALSDRHRTKTAVITIDRKWFPMQVALLSVSL